MGCLLSLFKDDTSEEILDCKPSSLMNMGATCYMNSAFQGISACDTFVKDINLLSSIEGHDRVKQLQVFKTLIDILNGHSNRHLEISKSPIFCHWKKFGQQDSYELLAYVLNEVYNELRKYKEKERIIPLRDLQKWLQEELPMRLLIQYKIECGCSKITFCPLQSDLALHVTIPIHQKKSSLKNLIDDFFSEDSIIDYQCDQKKCDGKETKRVVRLKKPLPRTLCIHLQRTFWNGRKMIKIKNTVEFQTILRIEPNFYLDEKENGELSGEDTDEKNSKLLRDNKHHDLSTKEVQVGTPDVPEYVYENKGLSEKNFANLKDQNSIVTGTHLNQDTFNTTDSLKLFKSNSDSKPNEELPITCQVIEGADTANESSLSYNENIKTNESTEGMVILSNEQEISKPTLTFEENAIKIDDIIDKTSRKSSEEELENISESKATADEYNLVSVIQHMGTVYSGHYVCYKKFNHQWYLTDDSAVRKVSVDDVLSCQAYILFYEKPSQ